MYSRWKYFERSEFACKCCGENLIVEAFVDILDEAREKAEIPFIILRGYKCKENNKVSGGTETSAYLKGLAADIRAKDRDEKSRILHGVILAGIRRIFIYRNYITVDVDHSKKACIMILS